MAIPQKKVYKRVNYESRKEVEAKEKRVAKYQNYDVLGNNNKKKEKEGEVAP